MRMDFLLSTASAGKLFTLVGVPIVGLLVFSVFSSMFWSKPKWPPAGKQCVVTGGSSGLGLAFATLLVKKGAHVAIIARDKKKLATALEKLEAARVHPDQKITSHSFSLTSLAGSTSALESAAEAHGGRAPDALFTCAGTAKPGYFLTMDENAMTEGMANSYWIQAFPALAATKMMVKQGVRGRVVFVGSTLGYMSFIGYSTYSPGKHALVGLTETLRSELALYDIDIQLFVPCTMYSEGYENENKTKPAITLNIEETDEGLTPEQAAVHMFKGRRVLRAGHLVDIMHALPTRVSPETDTLRISTAPGSRPPRNRLTSRRIHFQIYPLSPFSILSTLSDHLILTFSHPVIRFNRTGIQKGHAHFSADLITEFFRVSTRGSAPNQNVFKDFLIYLIAWPGVPIWRYSTERAVQRGKAAHIADMQAKGLVPESSK
ncbi:3-dehydrosphinganine reductase [Serendipita sp. 400]|nr:3-dehydrosphinganine reductase [Serendipita sp. 400]